MTINDVIELVEANHILGSHAALLVSFRLKTCRQVDGVEPRITSFTRAIAFNKAV